MNAVQEFISITPWTIVFQICNLLILMLLLKKFLFKPVMNVLSARQAEIDGIYDAAGQERETAKKLKREYDQKMSNVREEADQIVRTAILSANEKSDQIVDEANLQAMNMKKKASMEIEQERRKTFAELQNELSGMAVDIASQMVEREIKEEDYRELVESFIRNAGDDK